MLLHLSMYEDNHLKFRDMVLKVFKFNGMDVIVDGFLNFINSYKTDIKIKHFIDNDNIMSALLKAWFVLSEDETNTILNSAYSNLVSKNPNVHRGAFWKKQDNAYIECFGDYIWEKQSDGKYLQIPSDEYYFLT